MKRGLVLIVSVLSVLVVVAAVMGNSMPKRKILRATQAVRGSCTGCHEKLSQVVPENHFKVRLEEIKYCLICHSIDGPAVSFVWAIHLDHYCKPEFVGDCWSCHFIDQGKSFGLIESAGGQGLIEATKNVVEKMVPYFESWATSVHLDKRHARWSITCKGCHGTFFPQQRPAMGQCLQCHGSYQYLVALTKDVSPNPHDESHLGEIACTFCHKAHQESLLFCKNCHDYDLEVP